MNGEGILRFADGGKFKGNFKNGKREGVGIEERKDGTRFEGHFHNGMKDGAFVEKDANGNTTRKGTYRNDVLQ